MASPEESLSDVSVVIPLYNERESVEELGNAIIQVLTTSGRTFELIFIDDGSTDGSIDVLKKMRESQPSVKIRIIQFQKNYGKAAALSVGFSRIRGRYVVTIDADLQDEPAEIPKLLAKLGEGYDLVSGWKRDRQDPFIKRWSSKFYNYITSVTTGVYLHDHNCGLKAYRREVVQYLSIYGELHRYIPSIVCSYGFNVTELPVMHHKRKYGKTKYGLWRYFAGLFDLLTVLFLTRYTTRPLHLFGFIGLGSFTLGFFINLYLTIEKYFFGQGIGNRPLLFLGILLIILGFQFFSLGFLAEMITNIRSKDNHYIVKQIYE